MNNADGATQIPRLSSPLTRWSAYLLLWGLLFGIVWWRRAPAPGVENLPPAAPRAEFRIYLNSDGWERIALIEGIGESLARKIVAARVERGGFRSLQEVKDLPGVPDRPFDDAAPYLTLETK
ncbi:MAG: helix-hairpin-helix domain-containing protein [Planctomycetota bacterium]